MQLCKNRPEDFSTSSDISSLPTQCFFDVVLVPLPAWARIVFGLVIFPLLIRTPLADQLPRYQVKRRWQRLAHLGVYYFSVAVIVLMESVELAGLARINNGLGLLPFVYAGSIMSVVMQGTRGIHEKFRGWQLANLLFWILSLVMTTLKLVSLNQISMNGAAFRRQETSYAIDHQITDLAVLVAFYGVLIGQEISLMFQKPWSPPHTAEEERKWEL